MDRGRWNKINEVFAAALNFQGDSCEKLVCGAGLSARGQAPQSLLRSPQRINTEAAINDTAAVRSAVAMIAS